MHIFTYILYLVPFSSISGPFYENVMRVMAMSITHFLTLILDITANIFILVMIGYVCIIINIVLLST